MVNFSCVLQSSGTLRSLCCPFSKEKLSCLHCTEQLVRRVIKLVAPSITVVDGLVIENSRCLPN